jgi:molybdenum cofactor cytidylyltransferase
MLTVAAVLLSAGKSIRMRKAKALLDWGPDQSLIQYQIKTLIEVGYAPVVVVLGHNAKMLATHIPDHPMVTTVINGSYWAGRSSSIVEGIRSLPKAIDGILVISIDQPRSPEMLRNLRQKWEDTEPRPPVAVPTYAGQIGHPPLFSGSLVPMLLNISEKSQGMREVMVGFAKQRLLVPTNDPLTLTNMNTPEDYLKILNVASASTMYQL